MKWQILKKLKKPKNQKFQNIEIVETILENRNLKTNKEVESFLNPKKPEKIRIEELGIRKKDLKKITKRLQIAKEKKEKVVIFGDYDCDGVCATAILWESMYKLGYDVMPYIPDRFTEGYGLKTSSFEMLNAKNLNAKLIICVDNGIVAYDAINKAKELGIDIIVVDHHAKGSQPLNAYGILHSTKVCGSALSWFLVREISNKVEPSKQVLKRFDLDMLELCCIGTISDQMPLTNINRSIVKYGLEELNNTKRLGLKQIIKDSGITKVGVYEVGFMIAPRINAMGRLSHAIEALRLICTRDSLKALNLSKSLTETNTKRQKIVDEVVARVLEETSDKDKIMVVAGEYHEGVIGLASGRLTEKYHKPSIVISINKEVSKASARSIEGFNIIEAIKETNLILEGGGHTMAAGFSISTTKIEEFRKKINELANIKLTEELLEKKLKIDLVLNFENITIDLVEELKKLEPYGYGNSQPIFMSEKVKILEVKTVGSDGKHLKLKLEQNGIKLDAIWFNTQYKVQSTKYIDVAYSIEEHTWNSKTSIQLKIKDIILH